MLNPPGWQGSLNEVETLSAKAARGAGAEWGVAEDVARGVRWMAERGFDWSTTLLRLLESDPTAAHLRPVFRIADLLPGARPGNAWRPEGCEPVWVLALLCSALHGRDLTLDVTWEAGAARLRADGGLSAAEPIATPAALAPRPVTVAVREPAPPLGLAVATVRRGTAPVDVWRALERCAARTYVAASARSRSIGAGGGRVDAE